MTHLVMMCIMADFEVSTMSTSQDYFEPGIKNDVKKPFNVMAITGWTQTLCSKVNWIGFGSIFEVRKKNSDQFSKIITGCACCTLECGKFPFRKTCMTMSFDSQIHLGGRTNNNVQKATKMWSWLLVKMP